MGLIEHAQKELRLAGVDSKEAMYDGMLYNAIMELITTFSKQGHSGYSARIVIDIFNKLANFEPISPLTYEDDEFNDNNKNIRRSDVFRETEDGRFYYISAIQWLNPDGSVWTGTATCNGKSISSTQYIKHRNMPLKTFTIEVDDDFNVLNSDDLNDVFVYYDRYET